MATIKEVKVPNLGNVNQAEVIEVAVKPGDQIAQDAALITLESDKAAMDIPAPFAGVVKQVNLKVGSKVTSGSLILTLEVATATVDVTKEKNAPLAATAKAVAEKAVTATATATTQEILVPDLGNVASAEIIEIAVKVGDSITENESLMTLESDKAAMDLPAPCAGVITELKVKVGDKVTSGKLIALLKVATTAIASQAAPPAAATVPATADKVAEKSDTAITTRESSEAEPHQNIHAGPAVRRIAREVGLDLTKITPTGSKGRITKADIQAYAKAALAQGNGASALPAAPIVDFNQFGTTELRPLSRIKRLTATNLHRNWLLVPHVTQFEEADITELEAFRKAQQAEAEKQGVKLTPLIFVMKAVVNSLKAFPQFNASLDATGENLILKQYFHIGVAVDTPAGLVVPVIRDVDQKGLITLARELAEISTKARNKALTANEMQGGSFTISSLGGIGGTAFTPIVNLPEVAILGVSKASIKPVYQNGEFTPRLMLPLSLSYDHRVIDGAEGARLASI